MKVRMLVACVGSLLLLIVSADAVKLQFGVSPKNAQEIGFTVATKSADEGCVEYTFTRDLSKVRSNPPDSTIEIRRSASLEVVGDAGLIFRGPIEADNKSTTVTYTFTISRQVVAHSRFTVDEVDDYKPSEHREHLLGGGTFYEFNLADFPATE